LRFTNILPAFKFSLKASWANAEVHRPFDGKVQNVTLIPGIGIGPEITSSVLDVFKAANVPIQFDVLKDFTFEDAANRSLLQKNKCILMGVMVPEKGVIPKYNDNHKFYKHLDLYANINLCYSFPSVNNKHNNVDIAVIRENTEGEFSGIEHEVYPGVMESLKVTTRASSERLIQYAFEFAHLSGRKKVSVIHKANIMKLVDGLFLQVAR